MPQRRQGGLVLYLCVTNYPQTWLLTGTHLLLSSHLCGLGIWAQLSWALQLRLCHKTSGVTATAMDLSSSHWTKTFFQAPPCGGALLCGPLQAPHSTAVGFIREKRASLLGLPTHSLLC